MKKLFILFIFTTLIYCFSSFSHGLIDPDEPRYAATAKNMVLSGDYIVPYFNGKLRINKPPLTYWLVASSYNIFKINEFSSRLPHIILALFLILTGVFFLSKFLSVEEQLTFSIILASSPLFFYLARYCNTDMILTFFFSCSLIFFYKYFETKKIYFLIIFFISYFLANMSKGPVAYIVILIILIFLLIKREKKFFKNFKFWFIFFLISLSPVAYLYIVDIKTGGEFSLTNLIMRETAGRFLKGYRHPEPFYFYVEFFMLLFLPWSVFFIFNILKIKDFWKKSDFNKLNVIWFFSVLIFFSLSKSKLISYILPLSFPFAYMSTCLTRETNLKINSKYIIFFSIFIVLSIVTYIIVKGYAFPNLKILLLYILLIIFALFSILIEKNTFIALGIMNLIIFSSIFILGSNFINNNKSEKILSNIKEDYSVVSYRRKLTGIAFYYGNYTPVDTIEEIMSVADKSSKKVLIVSYKTDFKKIKNKITFKPVVETRRIIAVEFQKKNINK